MPVQFYSSEDSGAPQWRTSGLAAGSNNITEILDAVLVTGYGSKSACGWTKVMSSTVNDRVVYKNKSAYENDMNLIVQSRVSSANMILFQAAETVTTPEEYYSYSGVACMGLNYAITHWYAFGDERSFVFAVSLGNPGSHYYIYGPCYIYAGDFERENNDYPKSWGVVGVNNFSGHMDTNPASSGCDVLSNKGNIKRLGGNPLTMIPGKEWSEDQVYYHCSSLIAGQGLGAYWPSATSGIMQMKDFADNVVLKSPWYLIIEEYWVFRLRGIFSITPELFYWDKIENKRNYLIPFLIGDKEYIVSGAWSSVYFQVSGEW